MYYNNLLVIITLKFITSNNNQTTFIMRKLHIYILLIPILLSAQSYNGPESVEYSILNSSYYISNSSNGEVLQLDNNQNLSVFISGLNAGPHGLEISVGWNEDGEWGESILYACSGGTLYGYSLDGNELLNYNLNASFLNGISTNYINGSSQTYDLFITDFSAKKLYRYDIYNNTHDEICSFPKNPNGVLYDHINDRLLVVCWGWNAPIYEIDLINNTYTSIINTGLSNLDGITMDLCGNFYVSAWSSNSIHKYNSDFSSSENIISGLNNPADIDYNELDNIIAIPNSGNNTVDFFPYSCDNSSQKELLASPTLIQEIDLLGRENNLHGLKIEIYDNGSRAKKYLLK